MLIITIICTIVTFTNAATVTTPTTEEIFLHNFYKPTRDFSGWHYEIDIYQGMTCREMVPWFLDKAPRHHCNLTWGKADAGVGNVFLHELTANKPHVSWNGTASSLYTLIFTYLEPILDPWSFNEVQHWLVTDIPGCDISKGKEILEYSKPTSPEVNVYYQYVALIFKQPGPIDIQFDKNLDLNTTRHSIKVKELIKKYNLGDPISGSFMYLYEPQDRTHFMRILDPKKWALGWRERLQSY